MFRSIGLVIVIVAITKIFTAASVAFENAAVATFDTIEMAAVISQEQLKSQR